MGVASGIIFLGILKFDQLPQSVELHGTWYMSITAVKSANNFFSDNEVFEG